MRHKGSAIRHLFLGVLFLAGLTLQGTPPALPAAADLPIYTDGLPAGWGDWSWNATRDLQSTAEVYSGTYAVAVDLGDWGGLSFQHADFSTGPWEALVFYIHGGTAGGQQLRVFLHGDSVRQMIAGNAPGHDIQIAVTEYNSYYTTPEELAIQTVNMLFLADTLGQIIDQGFSFANHWDILNSLDANGGDYGYLLVDSANYRQPSYYVFRLWSRAGNQRIASTVNRDAGTEMTVYTSRHSTTGDVTLLVVNKMGEAQTGAVEVNGFKAAGTAEAYIAQGDSLDDPSVAYNGDEDPPIDLSTVPPLVTTGITETLTYTFPAYSVTSLSLRACHFADVNLDGDVNVDDITEVAAGWGCTCGAGCYNARYDFDNDCSIDIVDVMQVATHWGETCSSIESSEQ